jgi:FG-GAP-like repeat
VRILSTHRRGVALSCFVVLAASVAVATRLASHTAEEAVDRGPASSETRRSDDLRAPKERGLTSRFRDLGWRLDLRRQTSSYTVVTRDLDDDGWTDLLIGHHGHQADLLMNMPVDGETTGLSIVATFYDTIHERRDRHGCAIADVNLDGLDDIFCTKGAKSGTAKKWNELWMQSPSNVWTDRAGAYGVEDRWGRGRFPAFLHLNRDRYPDLFVGNDPRHDGRPSPNRTYLNVRGERFVEVRLGVSREFGNNCTDVADYDRDGRQDLLVCGQHRLFLFRQLPARFRSIGERVNLPLVRRPTAARFGHLNRDRRLDIVVITRESVAVRLQRADHTFGPTVAWRPLSNGHGVTVGDPDGDGDNDIYVVEGCVRRRNRDDVLLVNDGSGRHFLLRRMDRVRYGCGDTAATLDFDRDGMDEFVVLNGGGKDQPLDLDGPDQLLTMGDWGLRRRADDGGAGR